MFANNDKLSFADLNKNIAASVKVDTLISSSDIEHYQKLVVSAMYGKLSTPVMQGADMGGHGSSVFVPVTTDLQGSYRQVLLTEFGDIEQHNLAPEAALIADWLTHFGSH